jgi:lysophospholipase L1-like esterase
MGRLRYLVFALILAACGEAPPRLPALGADDVVLSFGDSLTYGTGARPEESYPAVLATLIGRTVVRAGVPGEVSADGRKRLSAELERHQPKLLILCHGGNDMLRKRPLAAMEANLRAMIEDARARGVAVMLLGVPRPALLGLAAAESYHTVAAASAVPLLADALAEILADNNLKADPIHPNAAGYARLAQAVADYLRTTGALE